MFEQVLIVPGITLAASAITAQPETAAG